MKSRFRACKRCWNRTIGRLAIVCTLLVPTIANAQAPAANASARASTKQLNASGSAPRGGGFEFPDYVMGGSAVSLQMPLQFGAATYLPKGRIGAQYDFQLLRRHWLYVGVAAVFDRGNWDTFRLDKCGLESVTSACKSGGVGGFELSAGYAHKFYLPQFPYLVPHAHGGLAYGLWGYPKVGGSRRQERVRTQTLHIRAGGGVRLFFLRELGIGFDLNMKLGFARHLDRPLQTGAKPPPASKETTFLLGFEILPLIAEYRF